MGRLRGAGARLAGASGLLGRAGAAGLLVLALGVAAGVLLVVGELSPLLVITLEPAGNCEVVAELDLRESCVQTGGERHAYALVILGLLALVMAVGAGIGRSRPAAVALALVGVAALVIVLAGDVPQLDETGAIGIRFEAAQAGSARGLWLSLGGGALAVAAGALALVRGERGYRR